MVKDICKNSFLLMQKSKEATKDDMQVVQDLMDTIIANKEICVGMAANMIGELKTIIAVNINSVYVPMINPVIISHSKKTYDADEGCLCHIGTKNTTRYDTITVEYLDRSFNKKKETYSGFSAQIIQHEIDHCNGILI